jgi:2,4-dichlorophenol 6-monooxygenase
VYNALGVELNQTYRSGAIAPDGTPEPAFGQDAELHYHAHTWPGARLPHCWLERDAKPVSVQDLCGHERFTLLTGIGGSGWKDAVRSVDVPIEVCEIGLGLPIKDPYADWRRLSDVEESGCVLVRPDLHIGWRCARFDENAAQALRQAMQRILRT